MLIAAGTSGTLSTTLDSNGYPLLYKIVFIDPEAQTTDSNGKYTFSFTLVSAYYPDMDNIVLGHARAGKNDTGLAMLLFDASETGGFGGVDAVGEDQFSAALFKKSLQPYTTDISLFPGKHASSTVYSTGTASQSGTTVTGSGTTWTSGMIGEGFRFDGGGGGGTITARASNTSITVSNSATVSPGTYSISITATPDNLQRYIHATAVPIKGTAVNGTLSFADNTTISIEYNNSLDLGTVDNTVYYIYFKLVNSSNTETSDFTDVDAAEIERTTTYSDATSDSRGLLAICSTGDVSESDEIAIQAFHGKGQNITADVIAANAITADAIKANSITSAELNFVPTDSTNVIASIRASNESLIIQGNKIEIDGSTTFSSVPSTTSANQQALNALAAAGIADAKAVTANNDADTAQDRADAAFSDAEDAQEDADLAKADLADIANDAKVAPAEKPGAKTLWDGIVAEYADLVAQAGGSYSNVSSTAYTNAYNALNTYLFTTINVFGNNSPNYDNQMANVTNITRSVWKTKWETYYSTRGALLTAIADQARSAAATADSTANSKTTTFRDSVANDATGQTGPTALKVGDIWINTHASSLKVYTAATLSGNANVVGTNWILRDDAGAINNATTNIQGGRIQTQAIILTEGGSSRILQGSSSDTAGDGVGSGTRILLHQEGIYGYNGSTVQFYMDALDGRAYFGGGAVKLDSAGMTLTNGGYIRSGTKAYAEDEAGFFLGYSGGKYKLDIGKESNHLRWDGTNLSVKGAITATSGTFTGTIAASAGTFGGITSNGTITFNQGNAVFIGSSTANPAITLESPSGYEAYISSGDGESSTGNIRIDAYEIELGNYTQPGHVKEVHQISFEPQSVEVDWTRINAAASFEIVTDDSTDTAGTSDNDHPIKLTTGSNATTASTISLLPGNTEALICSIPDGSAISTTTIQKLAVTYGITGDVTGNVTGNVTGSSGSSTGNAATATNVAYSGLTGSVPTWNQNTTGSAASYTGSSLSVSGSLTMGNYLIHSGDTDTYIAMATNRVYTVVNGTTAIDAYGFEHAHDDSTHDHVLVGIGGIYDTTYNLKVHGNAAKLTAGDWIGYSDDRIKENVASITNATAMLKLLNPITYTHTNQWHEAQPQLEERTQHGFLASEFEAVLPRQVITTKEDLVRLADGSHVSGEYSPKVEGAEALPEGATIVAENIKAIDPHLTAYLVAAIKELEARIAALEA